MVRTVLSVAALLMAAGAGLALAAPAEAPAILKNVPADYHAVIVVRNMQHLNEHAAALARAMGKADRLPPDITTLLAEWRGLNFALVDRTRPMVFLIRSLPTDEKTDLAGGMLLPVKDYGAFAADNKAETKEGRTIITSGVGEPLVTTRLGDYALLADDAKMAGELEKPARPLADALTAEQRDLMAAVDVTAHLNVAPVFDAIQPAIEKFIRASADPSLSMAADLLRTAGQSAEALDLGVVPAADGLELRWLLTAKADSPMARAFAGASKTAAAVRAVPMTNYLIAAGCERLLGPDSAFAQQLADVARRGLARQLGDVELAGKIIQSRQKLARLVKSAHVSLTAADVSGKPGLPLSVTVALDTTDATRARATVREYLSLVARAKLPATAPDAAPPAAAAAPMLQLTPDAETIGDVKVDRAVIRIDALTPLLGDAGAVLPRILGEEQLIVRIATRDTWLMVTLGGAKAMEAGLKAAQADQPTDDAGIKKVAGHVVDSPAGVAYLAVDRLANSALGLLATVAGIELPPFPAAGEPLTLSWSAKDRGITGRLYVPLSVLRATTGFIDKTKAADEPAPPAPAAQP